MASPSGVPFPCISCKQELLFKSVKSYGQVCPKCQALNFQNFISVSKGIKKMPLPQEDLSLIRIGSTGITGNLPSEAFEVIGRIQYFFQERYRNHWFILFADGNTGWLGDWEGNFSLFTLYKEVRNKFENPVPGKKVQINNKEYITERIDVSRYTGGEGEVGEVMLPEDKYITLEFFTVDADLALAQIFTDKKVELFRGHYRDKPSFHFEKLREYHDWV